MRYRTYAAAAVAATIGVAGAAAQAATVPLLPDDARLSEGRYRSSITTSALQWGQDPDATPTDGASISLSNVLRGLNTVNDWFARFAVNQSNTGFAARFDIGDPAAGLGGGQSLTNTSLSLIDFGNNNVVSTIDFTVFYADETQVEDLGDLDVSITGNDGTTGTVTDLGGGTFRLTSLGQGSGVDLGLSAADAGLFLGELSLFNYDSATAGDFLALAADREVLDGPAMTPVPVPAAAPLLLAALGGLGIAARHRK